MNVLIIGSGGREHSLFMTVKRDQRVEDVYMLGQNGAIGDEYLISDIDGLDFEAIYNKINELKIDMTIIGPELYLEAGLVDFLQAKKCKVFGPNKFCSQLESSKKFAKDLMASANIPTATYNYAQTYEEAIAIIAKMDYPLVLKYDGLAAGKGVLVAESEVEAIEFLSNIFNDNCFGSDGVIIEQCLVGEEYSVFALVDDQNYAILPIAQDYKRSFDNDLGLNTGGMGANTTHKYDNQLPFIEETILKPLLEQFNKLGDKYRGFLYIGLMQTSSGPKVIEFNVRMGDPETEVVMQKLDSSLIKLIELVQSEERVTVDFKEEEFVGVVLAANGYPKNYEKNVIINLNENMHPVFHMGTKKINNQLTSTGGRVLMVTASGNNICQAREKVYQKISTFENDKLFYRTDIGLGRV